VSFYLLFLAVSPLLHHDLECHLKTPSHCGACMASPLGLSAVTGAPLDDTHLYDAGSVKAVRATAPAPTFKVAAPGRSPPA
jgi:hypothetical protein